MLNIAAEVGFSETAFVAPREGRKRIVRYYSPVAEVPFCGHATIAAGVQLGELNGAGDYEFEIRPGTVHVVVGEEAGRAQASLTSVEPTHKAIPKAVLEAVLNALGWSASELDPDIPPANAYAGAWHLVIAVKELQRLNQLDYDFETLKHLMLENDLTTVQLIWRESPAVIHARDPFPVGGVVEDPATGAAAAALGGYLRATHRIEIPTRFVIRQGEAMGRPSRLVVDVPVAGGITVSGHAVRLPDDYPPLARRLLA
jgi:PhzF family phenazine biosynthesis protein